PLSRRLVGTHRFSPVLDLALSPCECKYSSPVVTQHTERDGSLIGRRCLAGSAGLSLGFRGFSGNARAEAADTMSGMTGSTPLPRQFGPTRTSLLPQRAGPWHSLSRARSATDSPGCI